MVGKFILGMVSGGVLVIGGLVVGSALFPLRPDATEATVAEAPAAVAEPATAPQPAPEPEPEPAPEPATEPDPAPQPDLAPEAAAETEETPEATDSGDGSEAPEGVTDSAPARTDEAATENAATTAPAAEAVPAEDPAPQPETAEAAALPEAEPEPVAEPPEVAEVTAPDQPAEPLPLPQLEPEGVLDALDKAAADPAPAASAEEEPALAEAEPEAMPEAEPAPAEPAPEPEVLPEPEIASLPEAAPEESATFAPAPGLTEEAEGVVVDRLPRIGDAEEPAAEEAEVAEAPADDTPPITLYAAAFENPEAKPVLAIVLIDTGAEDLDRAGIAALPFPVSIALDPLDPATPERAEVYRAGGKEVVMLATGLADGAVASDVEVSFQSMAQGLPQAVAVMDLPAGAFQSRRTLASIVVPVIGSQGRGLLTWDQGLNAADQVAQRDDVPAAVIFRDLMSSGEDRGSVRRLLERAVFKAGQDGRVAVAARATPDLVAWLLEWSVEGRAATVALGPVTAALRVD